MIATAIFRSEIKLTHIFLRLLIENINLKFLLYKSKFITTAIKLIQFQSVIRFKQIN